MAYQNQRGLEQRVRRAAAREGCRIVKSRVRDARRVDFGKVCAVDVFTNGVVGEWVSLEEAAVAWGVSAA